MVRLVVLIVLLAGVAALSFAADVTVADIRAWVESGGWAAPAVFVVLYAALTVGLVPGSILTTAAGVLFGAASGTGLALVGATLGATLAFEVARRTGRPAVRRLEAGHVARVDAWLADRGLLAVMSLRLVPLVPFSAANYAAGLTGIARRDYLVGTAIGIVPGTFAYTLLGANLADPTDPVFLAAAAGLVVLAVLGGVLLRRATTRSAGVDR